MTTSTAFAGPWESLPVPLTPWILDVVQSMGHPQMTPVQASTIPLFMKHKDVVVEAVTGSGKTLAFLIPVLERLIRRQTRYRRHEIAALVISPTRELATQIHSVFSLFLSSQPDKYHKSEATSNTSPPHETKYPLPLLLVSSRESSPLQDVSRFQDLGADIVIGTPGRVEEFLLGKGQRTVDVRELDVLVLDEADRLLDLGFQQTLARILAHLPKQRRTGLFSATMSDADDISELVRAGLRNPARITVKVQSKKVKRGCTADEQHSCEGAIEERRIPASLENYYLSCRASEKIVQLSRIIALEMSKNQSSQFIVYFATCACVDYFYKVLPSLLPPSITLHSLHGNLPPASRTRTLATFSSALSSPSSPSILLATDVAARGLDLPHVDVVIQFDPPSDTKTFSHRCGRTARAGRVGRAWVLLVGRETDYVDLMRLRKIPLKRQTYLNGNAATIVDERPEDLQVTEYLDTVRKTLLTDRSLHDQAVKAFVSFVRAYSKHEASYIFRIKDLDLVGVAKSFGLLRLPKMPEFKHIDRDGWEDAQVEWDAFAYADKAQETKRLATISITQEQKEKDRLLHSERKIANAAWSKKTKRKEEKEQRREKRNRKKIWLNTHIKNEPATLNASSKRTREDGRLDAPKDTGDDWEELGKEERMAKKVKKGTLNQEAFDAEFGIGQS